MVGVLHNRTALVTGTASGIGLGIAQALAREGARVLAVDSSEQALRQSFVESEAVQMLVLDVSADNAPQRMVWAVEDAFGGLDILMNNAGITGALAPIHETTDENWRKVMSVNVEPIFRTTRDFVPLLKKSKFGRVINTA